jgi:hypothetical protein
MAQYLPLPDGSSLKLREGESPAQGWARAQRTYPEAFAVAKPAEEPQGGFIPATKAGVASLKSDIAALLGRTGLIDTGTAEKYMQEQEEYQRRVFKPTEKGFLEAPVTKAAELLGGSLPYMAAPIVAGGAAVTAPVSAPVATALGVGAAGLTSAAQFTGSNIARQVEEGKRLQETELGAAAAAAVPQAALDMLSFKMMPGIRRIFMQAGKDVPEAAAKQIAEQNVREVIKDYSLATGKSMGVEGLTEAGQQVLERLQAGLNITDAEARDEYFESFLGGAILGGAISPAGRFIERGSQQRKQEAEAARLRVEEQRKLQEQKDRERAGELGAPLLTKEEAERPLFVDSEGKPAKFTDLQERERMLQEKEQAKTNAQQQYTEITKTINELRERAQTAGRNKSIELGQEAQRLEKLKDDLEKRVADKKDPLYKTKLEPFTQLTQEEAEKKLTPYDALEAQIKRAQAAFDKAKDQGDVIAQGKAAQKLKDLQEELRGTTPDLFGIEGQEQIAERAKAEAEAIDVVTLTNLLNLVDQKRKLREERRDVGQEEELKRLEAGLDRMGLGVLGVTGEDRIKAEVDLGQGFISPAMAEKLGIYDDQFNALQARLAKAATPEEEKTVKDEIKALKEKANDPTRAVDVLDNIETAYQNALAKQKETVDALAQEKPTLKIFDAKGQLTPKGKLAVANEAILRQLAQLRRLGRESKETLESQRAEDLFAAAPLKRDVEAEARTEAFGKAVTQTGKPIEGISEKQRQAEAEKGPAFTSRNEAFEEFTDAAYSLQRGQFLGKRTGVTAPEAERQRVEALQKKINKVEDDLKFLRGQQVRVGRQQAPAVQTRIAQLEGRLKTLKAGLGEEKVEKATARKLLIQKAERAADYLINNAINEVKADRVARGLGEMPAAEARTLETKLRIEFNQFIDRVSAAERTTGEMEERPVVKVVDGKIVTTTKTELAPKRPSIEQRPYEKLGPALKTLRGELEATVTEAKGLPAKGEFAEEKVEVAKPVKEKPVKTTKKKIAERQKAAKHEVRKREAIYAGKQVIADNQKKIRDAEQRLRTLGSEIARLRKAATGDKNPQMRLAKAERIEVEMDSVRANLLELRNTNKTLAAAMRTLGVPTGSSKSGAYLLDMIENDEPVNADELTEAGVESAVSKRVTELQKTRDIQLKELALEETKLAALKRRLSLNKFFGGPLTTEKQLNNLRKQIEFQERVVGQAKGDVNVTKKAIFAALRLSDVTIPQLRREVATKQRYVKEDEAKLKALENRAKFYKTVPDSLNNEIAAQKEVLAQSKVKLVRAESELDSGLKAVAEQKQLKKEIKEKGTSRFTDYELITAARFLMSRIDQVIERMGTRQKVVPEGDRLIKAQLGTITAPSGKTLPGVRVTTEMEWSAKALNETAEQERELYQKQYEEAVTERDSIAEKLRAAGKPIRGDEAYEKAAAKARNLARSKKAVRDFVYGYVPIRTEQQIFATDADAKEVLGQRQRQTADFVQDKPLDAEEIAKDVHAMLVENVRLAEDALRNIPAGDKNAIKKAKGALTRARNQLSKGSIYKIRSTLTEADLIEQASEVGTDELLEIDAGTMSDQDIINAIDYKDDTIDPRFGEEPTEIIDEEEANKLLANVKTKAKAQDIEFEYYDSVEKLPIGIRKQMAKQGMDTVASQLKGGVYKGKVFVIVQNHNDITDLQQTLAHELVGHYSFDGLLGKEGMIKLSQQIDRTPDGLAKLAEQLGGTKFKEQIEGVFIDTIRYYKKAFEDGKITDAQIRANAKIKALREMIAYTMEKKVTASRMEKLKSWYKELVGAMRAALRKLGIDLKISTSDLFYLMKQAQQNFEAGKPVAYRDVDDTISFRRGPEPPKTGLGAMVAPRGKPFDTIKANLLGLNFRVQFVDRLAALDALVKRGVDAGLIDSIKAMDVLYFSRKADQRNNMTAQFVTNGVGKIAKINGEYQYVGGEGPSMKDVSEALNKSGLSPKIVEDEFTQYEIALRAKDVGVDKLDFTKQKVTQQDVDATIAKYSGKDPASLAFQEAHKLYQQYNRNLIDFLVSSGALSAVEGARLKGMNYVPYYRKRGGAMELVVFGEQPIRIGDMKNQPYLEQLVGGEEKILPIFTGAVQNTQLLVDMAMKNMATRNTAFVLAEMGLLDVSEKQAAKGLTGMHKGMGPADANVIRFKLDGDDMWARVNVEAKKDIFGDIPTELVVTGMEGIKATLPVGIRLLGMPANLLRKLVTRDPRYAVRQIFRDSMSAVLTTGANFVPVVQTIKDITTMKKGEAYKKLQESGSLGGQVVTGATDDMDKILLQIASGKRGWTRAMAKLDELAMMGDAATRVSMYNSFIKQGLSEREADFATMEAMNFSRRGLSPSILYANTMIPFFNAGVQGIDVLYRAFKGDMPSSQRLQIQRKLWMRGLMMAGMTLAYAAAMDDDKTYENANPDERYNNWFVPTPLGTLRVPIPFEAGFIFKGIPEGVYRMAFTDDKNEDVLKALKDLAVRSVPVDMPTAIKPVVELMLNRSFFTGREIVDKSMSEIAKYQYRPNTPETIKLFGEIGISPAKVEYFIKGYTGSLPLGLIGAMETVTGIRSMDKEKPTMRIYEAPIVGGLFQPPDASGMINRAFETVNRAQGAQATYNRLSESDPEEAAEFLKQNMKDIDIGQFAGQFRQEMGEITAYERYVRESRSLSADEKRRRLDKLKQEKINLAKDFNKFNAQIERQAAR